MWLFLFYKIRVGEITIYDLFKRRKIKSGKTLS